MKKRYLLWSVFLVISSVLIFSFLSNGCTNNNQHVKEEKELKYPEWPGLDNRIEDLNNIFLQVKKEFPECKITQLSQLEIKETDIKWHLLIKFKYGVKESQKEDFIKKLRDLAGKELPIDFKFSIYKNIENYLYIKLNDVKYVSKIYYYLTNTNIKGIPLKDRKINPLLEFSTEHYSPLHLDEIFIQFLSTMTKEEIHNYTQIHSLKIIKKLDFNDKNRNVWLFSLPENIDIILYYNKLFESEKVRSVEFCTDTMGGFLIDEKY